MQKKTVVDWIIGELCSCHGAKAVADKNSHIY